MSLLPYFLVFCVGHLRKFKPLHEFEEAGLQSPFIKAKFSLIKCISVGGLDEMVPGPKLGGTSP